ncbi:MAG: DUF4174 domain-containing protein [Hyphomicrobium sp.]|nr:DUF4174 domain-containing protein [Hyphomicrobium sp.]
MMLMVVRSVAALATLAVFATTVQAMSNYRWKKRPLVVFADSDGSPLLAEQRQIVARNQSDLNKRDVVVVWVVGQTVSTELGPPPNSNATSLRARYAVADGEFRAVLVGKDGGEKLSLSKPLAADKLIATIDAMPMRRDEMRRR